MDNQNIFELYKLAIAARNFHYDNFNKWMNFFYVAVGAILISYFSSKGDIEKFRPLLALLGLVISFYGYLSCKGYYYWIHNWIWQVSRIEGRLDKSDILYKSFSEEVIKNNDKILKINSSANISTSKMSLLFFLTICYTFAFILSYHIVDNLYFLNKIGFYVLQYLVLAGVLIYCLMLIAYLFRKSIDSNIAAHTIVKCDISENDPKSEETNNKSK